MLRWVDINQLGCNPQPRLSALAAPLLASASPNCFLNCFALLVASGEGERKRAHSKKNGRQKQTREGEGRTTVSPCEDVGMCTSLHFTFLTGGQRTGHAARAPPTAGTAHAHERHKRTHPGTPLRPRNSSSADPGTGHLVAQVSPRRACLRMRPPVAAFLGAQPRRPALRGRPARRWGLGAGRSVPPFHSVPVRGRRPTAQAARSLRESTDREHRSQT